MCTLFLATHFTVKLRIVEMRQIVFLVAFVTCASALVEVGSPGGYHVDVGIPLGIRIKAEEDIIIARNSSRIVGGEAAPVNEHPYLAGLLITLVDVSGTSICGASLITASRLVTAAHCWFDGVHQALRFTVVLGSQFLFAGGQRIPTTDVSAHPQWDPSSLSNDVAIIRLAESVSYSESIQAISLPQPEQLSLTFEGESAVAAGYGFTSDQHSGVSLATNVNQVTVQVISQAACQRVYGAQFVRGSTLCTSGAGGAGLCRGDSGAPLVLTSDGRKILVGIGSFTAGTGCEQGHPSAFARITSFYSYILS